MPNYHITRDDVKKYKGNPNGAIMPDYVGQLCIDELKWCRKNQESIVNKANVLYNLCLGDTGYKGKSRCLDFKKLEYICDKYNNGSEM